jgi:tetratricopeptide (TPR) repeat protein
MRQTSAHLPHSEPVAEFRANRIVNQLPAVLFFLIFAFLAVVSYPYIQSSPISFLITILLSLGSMALIIIGYFRMVYRMVFYHEGIHIQSGLRDIFLAWQEITATNAKVTHYNGLYFLFNYIYWGDGQKIQVGPWDRNDSWFKLAASPIEQIDLDTAIDFIQEASFEHRYNHAVSRMEQGAWIDFKHFSLSKIGIRHKQRVLHWQMVSDIDATDDRILVRSLGEDKPWAILKFEVVPNRDLVPPLVGRYGGEQLSVFQKEEIDPLLVKNIKRRVLFGNLLGWAPFIFIGLVILGIIGASIYDYNTRNQERALWAKGDAAIAQGDGATALEIFDTFVERNPRYAEAYLNRGRSYALLEQYDLALADYKRANSLRPNDERIVFYFGRLYQRQSEWEQVLAYYQVSLRLHETRERTQVITYPWVFYRQAQVYRELGDYDEAVRRLTSGLNAPKVEEDVRALMIQELEAIQQL